MSVNEERKVGRLVKAQLKEAWATPVYFVTFGQATELNKQLTKVILLQEERLSMKNDTAQELRPWNTFSQLHVKQRLFDWKHPAIKVLHSMVYQASNEYLREALKYKEVRLRISSWANVSRLGDWHGLHSHFAGGRQIASGVYWIKVPRSTVPTNEMDGHLILYDPRGPFFPERQKMIIRPEAGKMVIQPAWLSHEVAPVRSRGMRISVAFDVEVEQ